MRRKRVYYWDARKDLLQEVLDKHGLPYRNIYETMLSHVLYDIFEKYDVMTKPTTPKTGE